MGMRLLGPVYLVGGQDYHMTYLDWPANDCNVYLIDTGDPLVLVDCGCGESLSGIMGNVKQMGFRSHDIGHVLLTHAHMPHAGAAEALRRNHTEVMAGPVAAETLRSGGLDTSAYHYWRRFSPVEKITEVADEATLKLGKFEFTALHLPGHSTGCVGYQVTCENRTMLFCGDTVRWPGMEQIRGRLDYDREAYVETLRRLLADPPDVLYPGHGPFCLSHADQWIGEELKRLLRTPA
jgi:metallo-beta-lactamase class B